jgi:hypothetical protein
MIDVKESLAELKEKSYDQVQIETAFKWASRSCACYLTVVGSQPMTKLLWWTMGAEYQSEAIEHASLSGEDSSSLVKQIQEEIRVYQEKAFENMESTFGG